MGGGGVLCETEGEGVRDAGEENDHDTIDVAVHIKMWSFVYHHLRH